MRKFLMVLFCLVCVSIFAEDIVIWECPKSMRLIYREETGQQLWQDWKVINDKAQWVDCK